MLSTIVFCEDRPELLPGRGLAVVLARTLASLVTAKVEGLLGDVRIAGPADQDLGLLAHHAGCDLVEAENEAAWLGQALELVRESNVFLLRCGRAADSGFIEEANDFLAAKDGARRPAAVLRASPESFFERLFPTCAPVAGLIAPRDLLLKVPRGGFGPLVRALAPANSFHSVARRIR